MRHYELMVILDPEIEERTVAPSLDQFLSVVKTDGGSIEIGASASTQMACEEPAGVMDQEAAYLAALPTAVRYRVDGGSLALLSADGTYVASYTRATQP